MPQNIMRTLIRSITIILFVVAFINAQAAYIRNFPMTVNQPDGTEIECFATGDEYYNWLHDEDNYTIIQSQVDGYYYYAQLDNGTLVPSIYKVGITNPSLTNLKAGENISGEQMKEIRNRILKETPPKPVPADYVKGRSGSGVINNLCMFISFADQNEFTSDTMLNYNRFNDSTTGASSQYNYFKYTSYGELDIVTYLYPKSTTNIIVSYQDIYDRSYYMPYNASTNPDGYLDSERAEREHALLRRTIEFVVASGQIPAGLDLDYDNDNLVDNICFIVRGGPTAWSTLLWPHKWSLWSEDVYINGKQVWTYNFQLETHLAENAVGVLCHEMGHTLSMPDLYHYTGNGISPAGPWDVMESNSNPPQSMLAFMKYKYCDFIDSIPEITESGTYTLYPLSSTEKNCYKIASPNSNSQYFMVEYRVKEGTFEGSLPGSGMLIYRIDPGAGNGNASGPPDEVYIYRPNGTPSNNGSIVTANFAADHGRTDINDETNPSSFLQNGSAGGLFITDISTVGDSMTFRVEFESVPEAYFISDVQIACKNDKIQFKDKSSGIPDTWEWEFEPNTVNFVDGTTSNSKDPIVEFQENGYYRVQLTASNGLGSNLLSVDDYMLVGALSAPITNDFENGLLRSGGWKVINEDGGITWDIAEVGGNNSQYAAVLNFREYTAVGKRDQLVSPPISLQWMTNAQLSFEHAYAKYHEPITDSLIVYISGDCGENWTRVFNGGDDGSGNFATHPITQDPWWPETADDWCSNGYGPVCTTVDLSEWLGSSTVLVMFESYSFYGNPLFVDNISIDGTVGNNDNKDELSIEIHPNPNTGIFEVSIYQQDEDLTLKILNGQGQLVHNEIMDKLNRRSQINLTHLSPGLYYLRFSGQTINQIKKIIIQ